MRIFQKSDRLKIRFQLYVQANPEMLAIEVVSANGSRCVQIQIDKKGSLLAKNGMQPLSHVSEIPLHQWIHLEFDINARKQRYHIRMDEKTIAENFGFAAAEKPERIIFRTGVYRLQDDVQEYKSGRFCTRLG